MVGRHPRLIGHICRPPLVSASRLETHASPCVSARVVRSCEFLRRPPRHLTRPAGYEECANRQGILQQWIQVHHIGVEDLATVLATVRSVFPPVTFWVFGSQGIIVALRSPLKLSTEGAAQYFAGAPALGLGRGAARDLFERALASRLLSEEDVTRLASDPRVDINSHRNRHLEYASARHVMDRAARSPWLPTIPRRTGHWSRRRTPDARERGRSRPPERVRERDRRVVDAARRALSRPLLDQPHAIPTSSSPRVIPKTPRMHRPSADRDVGPASPHDIRQDDLDRPVAAGLLPHEDYVRESVAVHIADAQAPARVNPPRVKSLG
jgi:hypothetical protein